MSPLHREIDVDFGARCRVAKRELGAAQSHHRNLQPSSAPSTRPATRARAAKGCIGRNNRIIC